MRKFKIKKFLDFILNFIINYNNYLKRENDWYFIDFLILCQNVYKNLYFEIVSDCFLCSEGLNSHFLLKINFSNMYFLSKMDCPLKFLCFNSLFFQSKVAQSHHKPPKTSLYSLFLFPSKVKINRLLLKS